MLKWRVRSPLSFLGCETPLQVSPANARAEDASGEGVRASGLPAVASSSFSAPATPVPNRSFLHRAFVPTSPASIGIAEALGFYDGGLGGKKPPAEGAAGPEKVALPAGSLDGGGGSQCLGGRDGEVQDDQDRGALPRESHCQDEGQGEGKQGARGQGRDQGQDPGQGQAKQASQTDAQLQAAKPQSQDINVKPCTSEIVEEKVPDSHYSQPRNNKPIASPETGTLPRPPSSKPLLRYFFGTMDNHISSLRSSHERRSRPSASHAKGGGEDRHYAQPRSNKCVNCKKNSGAERPVTRRVCGVKSLPLTLERKKSKSTFYVDVPDISSPETTDRKSEQRSCSCACGRAEGGRRERAAKEESGRKLPIDPSDLYSKPRKRRAKPGNPPAERAKAPPKQSSEPQKHDASNRENESNNPTAEYSEPKNLPCDSFSHYSEPRKTCIEVKQHQSESVSHYSAPRRHSEEPKNLIVESVSHYSEPRKQSTEPKNPLSEASGHYSQPRKTILSGPRAQSAVGVATQTNPEDFDETSSKRLEGKSEDESTRTTERTEGARCRNVEAHEYEPLDVVGESENHLDDALDFRDALGYKRAREIRKQRGKAGKEEGEEKTKNRKHKTKDKEKKSGTGRGKKGGAKSKEHKSEPPEDPPGTSRRSRRLTRDEIVRKLKSIYRIEPTTPSSASSSAASPPSPTADKSNDASTSSSSAIRPCYNTFPRPRPRPRPATQTSPLISSESIPDGAYVDLFPVLVS